MNGIDYKKLGFFIKEKRKELNLTQKELGEKIGKTESSIRKYEKGLINIPNDVLEKLANFLGVSFFRLISPEYEKKIKNDINESYNDIYNKVVENKDEKPLYVERMIILDQINEILKSKIVEYIGQRFLYHKLEIDKYEIEIISEKTISYLDALIHECVLKKRKEETEMIINFLKNSQQEPKS